MLKNEFLEKLQEGLNGLSPEDVEDRLSFYSEMIDDRMEEGLSESDAVAAVGSVENTIRQIIEDTPLMKIVKDNVKRKRKLTALEIILLVLGSPLWLSVGIAIFAVIVALYVSLWAVIVAIWAVFASFTACSLGGILSGIIFAFSGNSLPGIAWIGAAILCGGLSVFAFYGCKAATFGTVKLTKYCIFSLKNVILKKEGA